ncbi:unnamed protein product [Phyllotreta striolata]|uniref:Amine oxidase domain-containing protein n=1 Tax=Phyllotreta striolata TaxID=444603 RepID=A0A9N9TZR9_PHYSR|nr:unnamed protein product [Phyllotreta striolata]
MSGVPSVLIIGAGAAGVAAATRLLENGIDNIKILEAENRIGGRIYSLEFDGVFIDLGGQWVHGEKGNIVYEMVKDLGLLHTSFNNYEDNTFYMSNGENVNKNITDRLFQIGLSIIEDSECAIQHPGPYGNYFIKIYKEKVSEEFKDDASALELAACVQDWFHKFCICLDSAKSWYEISTLGAACRFEYCEGDQQLNWGERGFKTILDVLMKKIPDASKQLHLDDKILLKKVVKKIQWGDSEQTVTCEDGSVFTADHVIITCSVGVLKTTYRSLFDPALPSYKVNSIEHISMGTVNKILLRFPRKWWPEDTKGFSLLWTDEDRKNLVNEIPSLGPVDEDGRSWLEDVFGFYVIDNHPRILLGWVVGKMAAEVEHCTDEDVTQGCMALLRKFVGNKYDIPTPDAILRSSWNSNPHFCGSYVYSSIEQDEYNASSEDLARPIVSEKSKKPVLLFAGEATSTNHYSTVNGAIETGYREADRLIEFYK